jgi:tetratricopeptide (TPR) repeat protein
MDPSPDRELLRKLSEEMHAADDADEIGYVRHLCELILEERPKHTPTLLLHARNLMLLSQYDEAAKLLERIEATILPEHQHMLHSCRGHLAQHRGYFAEADACFMKAHELAPREARYLIYAGSAAFGRGDIERAEHLTRRATECPEGCIEEAWFNLGGSLLSQKRYQEAKKCYQRALELDPDYDIAMARLVDVNKILRMIYESGE